MDADVVIVGAGPAGASAACHFARAGFRVILMDQHHFPRDKVCGDFVGPWSLEEIDRLGLSTKPPFHDANRIQYADLHLNGNKIVESPIPRLHGIRQYGLCIPRLQLDRAIADAAVASGARLLQLARVTGYETDANSVAVFYQDGASPKCLRTRLLIGADGSTSRIAQILRGKQSPKRNRIIAVRAYFDDVSGARDKASLYADSSVFPGYYWLFPSGETSANVGIGALLETWPANNEHLRLCLLNRIETDSAFRHRLANSRLSGKIAGWPLATFDPHLSLVDDRVALVGDAAGLINPLNGEGIQYALQSGRWSFETLADVLSHDDVSKTGLAPYAGRVHAELCFDMAICRLFVDISRNRTLNDIWLSALRAIGMRASLDPQYAAVFGGVLAGIVQSRQLLTMPFIWRTVMQYAEMIRPASATDALRACVAMATYSVHHPTATLRWSLQCIVTAFEVVAQLAHQ